MTENPSRFNGITAKIGEEANLVQFVKTKFIDLDTGMEQPNEHRACWDSIDVLC